jgi:hypothetical protein
MAKNGSPEPSGGGTSRTVKGQPVARTQTGRSRRGRLWEFPVLVSDGPEGTYRSGYPYEATEDEFFEAVNDLLGKARLVARRAS